jgi:4-amino-4-deoxy-L-arabinose transferase-like glycosyltransferase
MDSSGAQRGTAAGEKPRVAGWKCATALLLILLLGAALRFHRVTELEPAIWDEGSYALEARFLSTFCRGVYDSARRFLEERLSGQDVWKREVELPRIREETEGLPPKYGRILHVTFVAAANLLAGESPHNGNVVNAIFGTLTVLAVFFAGRILYDDRVGLAAALILSVMGYHIHYSRSCLAEVDTLFFVVLAFVFYTRSRCRYPGLSQKDMALCGLFLGIGFTAHNRCIVIFALIFLLELLLYRKPGGIARDVRRMRLFLLTGFFLLPAFLWESFYHLVFILFRRLQVPMTTPTFLEQVLYGFWHSLLWGYVSENFRPAGFLTFPYLYQHMNGILALALLAAGLFVAFRRPSLGDRILGAWFAFPFVLYSLTNAGLSRFFVLILPPAAILSAAALFPAPGTKGALPLLPPGARTPLKAVLLALLAVSGVLCSWTRVLPPASGYAEAMAFLKRQPTTRQIATGVPLCQVFVGVEDVERPPESMEALEALYRKGFRYYVIDFNRIIYTYYQMNRVEVMDRIAQKLDPVSSTPNELILRPQNAFEGNLYFWKTLAMMKTIRKEKMDRIRIFDLKEYFGPFEEP